MDINALLSPDDGAAVKNDDDDLAPSNSAPQTSRTNRVRPSGKPSSGLSQEITRSPDRRPSFTPQQEQQQPRPSYPSHPPPVASHHHRLANATTPAADYRPLPPTSFPAAPDPAPGHQTNTTSQQTYRDTSRPVIAHRPSSTPSMETLAGKYISSPHLPQVLLQW
jgi:hypothetical protein